MKVFVTGYYGTGSSALIDLLAEFSSVSVAQGRRYEHNVFCCHDGLLDLEQRLFGEYSNQMIRDVAINEFIKEMKKQNDYDFGWYGSYKKLFGNAFENLVDEFVNSVSVIGGQDLFSHTVKTRFSLGKAVLQIGAALFNKYKITKLGRKYVHDKGKTRYLTVSHEEFTEAARTFSQKYFSFFERKDKLSVFDHVLLPEQCGAMNTFFPDDKLIIVDRDPRDIYFSSYYVWNQISNGRQIVPFPLGVEAFCENWKRIHRGVGENAAHNGNILLIQFEDLVYKYEETLERVIRFIGLENPRHDEENKYFNPKISIKNTQIFAKNDSFQKDSAVIEKELEKYLYAFPFATETALNEAKDI